MAKFCGQCGTENPDAGRFCLQCGESFGRIGAGTPPTVQGVPAGKRGINWALVIAVGTVVFLAALAYGQAQQPSGNQQASVVAATETPVPANPTPAQPASVDATANSQDTATAHQASVEQTAATALPTDVPATEPPLTTDTDTPVATELPPTLIPTQTAAEFVQSASAITYADVRDHADSYLGYKVVWSCTINKFLPDTGSGTATVTCGVPNGTILPGEIALLVPLTIDVTPMHAGDSVTVAGVVDSPMQGTNSFGATLTEPAIDVVYLTDHTLEAPSPTQTLQP